jgi:3-oxoadipate enol-lactonase
MGAGIVAEAALARPELAASITLIAPGGALIDKVPDRFRTIWGAEVDALDRGDIDGATEVNMRAWVDGPRRGPEAVDPGVRTFIAQMQREAFEIPEWDADDAPEHELVPAASGRLSELRCPVLVLVGDADDPAIVEIAQQVAADVPDGRLVVWPDVGHMLPLERPAELADLIGSFVAEVG